MLPGNQVGSTYPTIYPDKPFKKVAEGLHESLDKYGATKTFIGIGGDSTNSNTGWLGPILT